MEYGASEDHNSFGDVEYGASEDHNSFGDVWNMVLVKITTALVRCGIWC